jgi:hypothetical protein
MRDRTVDSSSNSNNNAEQAGREVWLDCCFLAYLAFGTICLIGAGLASLALRGGF